MTKIRYAQKLSPALSGAQVLFLAAPRAALDAGWAGKVLGAGLAKALEPLLADAKPGDLGSVVSTYGPEGAPRRIFLAALPDRVGRHNSPTRSEFLRHVLAQVKPEGAKKLAAACCLSEPEHYLAAAITVARAFPLYDRKTGDGPADRIVRFCGTDPEGVPIRAPKGVAETVEAVRLACRLVDTPAQELRTADLEAEARRAVKGLPGVTVTSVVGDRLLASKLGGIHAVGRAASVPPRLVQLEYRPAKKPRRTVALVGKGIVYDTGGLSIKTGGIMSGMKGDMGGAAAVLGAFLALVGTGCPDRLYGVLCLAENAVGPESYRPDDIVVMHSGKTVEINNTDAEGRLLLADGVSWAARRLKADLLIDAATLTGAALVTTGRAVSCTVSNRDGLEAKAVAAGRRTGDLTFPILFIPELTKQEFPSKVADMRNSVKDRMNAQSSCAAQFVYNHIEDVNPGWIHLDIAGPAFRDDRGTGHGVALMAEIVRTVEPADFAE